MILDKKFVSFTSEDMKSFKTLVKAAKRQTSWLTTDYAFEFQDDDGIVKGFEHQYVGGGHDDWKEAASYTTNFADKHKDAMILVDGVKKFPPEIPLVMTLNGDAFVSDDASAYLALEFALAGTALVTEAAKMFTTKVLLAPTAPSLI